MKRQIELSRATAYTGTCVDMCPERERESRLGFQLSIFERDQEDQPDKWLMVKEYRRAGADQEEPAPDDLRTPRALEATMDHLVYNVMDDSRSLSPELALEWYDFLWDRLRAIRKDITQQNICDQASAILVERCTRFHVHSCYAMNHVKDFDVDMNKRNLNDCLQMLRQMYHDLKGEGINCYGELEFQKYNILLHLDEDALSTTVLLKTSDHRSSMEMKFVIQIFNAYLNNDYYKFFQLMQRADYMTSCILSLYVNRLRLKALKIMLNSCTSRQMALYPADLVIETLGFDDLNDLSNFLATLEIQLEKKSSRHYLVLNKDLVRNIDRTTLPPFKSRRLVESKMLDRTVGELVYGSTNESRSSSPLQDGNIFMEEETVSTIIGDEEDKRTSKMTHKEPSAMHKLVITNVRESDEAIYSLKAENDLGSTKSSLVSLTIDKRKEATDELSESRSKQQNKSSEETVVVEEEEEATTTVVTQTTTITEKEDQLEDIERRKKKSPNIRSEFDDDHEYESDESANKRRKIAHMMESTEKREEEEAVARSRREKIMPAGRFRRKTYAKALLTRPQPQQSTKQIPPPLKPAISKSAIYKKKIVNMQQAIKLESKANEKLLELIKVFFQ